MAGFASSFEGFDSSGVGFAASVRRGFVSAFGFEEDDEAAFDDDDDDELELVAEDDELELLAAGFDSAGLALESALVLLLLLPLLLLTACVVPHGRCGTEAVALGVLDALLLLLGVGSVARES
jgi:hypothetical protein